MSPVTALWRRRKIVLAAAAAVLVGAAAFWGISRSHAAPTIPTAAVERTDFVHWVQLRGQVKALESVHIAAPYRAGDLQILKLVPSGATVKKGDVLVKFDPSQLDQTLAQDKVDVQSAEAEIQQSRAKSRLKEEQDLTDVMKARYAVQSAQLEASKAEIVSKIEGAEAELKLADARQQLKEAEAKLKADKASDAADLKSYQEKRDEAAYQVRLAQHNIDELTVRAPINGVVTLLDTNWNAGGPFGNPQPFKTGDRVWSGAPIAELPDLSTLEIEARVDETERGSLQVGQKTSVRIAAVPDREFNGKVTQISTLASSDFSAGWPFPRNFTVRISLDRSDPRLRPGMNGTVRVAVDRVLNGIVIPGEALFHRNGESVAYVLHGSKFEPRKIEVAQESSDQVLVAKGLQAGERVALKDPTTRSP